MGPLCHTDVSYGPEDSSPAGQKPCYRIGPTPRLPGMCHSREVSYDTVVWLPNALVMTVLLGLFAWWRWRRKGLVSGLRWTGVAMLPLALYAMGLFKLGWQIGLAFSHFVTGFVWRPSVWIGLIMTVVALALILLPGKRERTGQGAPSGDKRQLTASKKKAPADNDMAEIEDILKRHGIG